MNEAETTGGIFWRWMHGLLRKISADIFLHLLNCLIISCKDNKNVEIRQIICVKLSNLTIKTHNSGVMYSGRQVMPSF